MFKPGVVAKNGKHWADVASEINRAASIEARKQKEEARRWTLGRGSWNPVFEINGYPNQRKTVVPKLHASDPVQI